MVKTKGALSGSGIVDRCDVGQSAHVAWILSANVECLCVCLLSFLPALSALEPRHVLCNCCSPQVASKPGFTTAKWTAHGVMKPVLLRNSPRAFHRVGRGDVDPIDVCHNSSVVVPFVSRHVFRPLPCVMLQGLALTGGRRKKKPATAWFVVDDSRRVRPPDQQVMLKGLLQREQTHSWTIKNSGKILNPRTNNPSDGNFFRIMMRYFVWRICEFSDIFQLCLFS